MVKKQPAKRERLVMARSPSGFESRPLDAETRYPMLAAALEAFRRQGVADSAIDFVFIGDDARTFRVRLECGSVTNVQASLEALEAPVPLGFTVRELDVVSLMCVGCSYAAIAESLRLSLRTVTTHAEHIFTKLATNNRTEAVVLALQHGAVRLPLPAATPSASLLGRIDDEMRRLEPADWRRPVGSIPGRTRAPGSSLGAIRIGHIHATNDSEGQEMLFGAQLAVEEINAGGGVSGRPLELVAVGADVSSMESIKAGTEAVMRENIDALSFGYADPRESLPELLGFWREAGIPVLHSLTSQLVCKIIATGSGYGNIFQVCPSDDSYGDEFLRFVKRVTQSGLVDERRRDIVMLTDDPQMADYHRGWAERALRIGYDLTLISATAEAEAVEAARVITAASPALVFLACFRSSTLRSFLREFMLRPAPSLLYGLWAPGTSDFRNDLEEFEGLVWSTATGRYADALGKRFEQGFQSRFGRPVYGTSASIQYDSIGILAHAWQRSGRPGSYRATTEELRRLIHRGVNGSYFFGAEYQRPLAYGIESRDASLSQAHLVYQIQDGVNRIISPAPYASSRYRPQPWLRVPIAA